MKWTIQELKKLSRTSNTFSYDIDFRSNLDPEDIDILDIENTHVDGRFTMVNDDSAVFEVRVSTTLVMPCARTLQEVLVPLTFDTTMTFSKQTQDDFSYPIDGITIDLDPYVFSEILVEKPLTVISEDADEYLPDELPETEEDTESPFAKLLKNRR